MDNQPKLDMGNTIETIKISLAPKFEFIYFWRQILKNNPIFTHLAENWYSVVLKDGEEDGDAYS